MKVEMLVFDAQNRQDRDPMQPTEPAELTELTAYERALIDFEREWWLLDARKDVEIRARFAISSSSYYRMLHALVARPDAMTHDPLTVLRLRKRREQARRGRIEGRRADPGTR